MWRKFLFNKNHSLPNQVFPKIVFFRKLGFLVIFSSYIDFNFTRSTALLTVPFGNFNALVVSIIAPYFCGIDLKNVALLLIPLVFIPLS